MKQTTEFLRVTLFSTALLILIAIAGCGQKGPLYMPDNPSEMQTILPDAIETGEEEQSDGEEEAAAPGERVE